MLLGGILSYRRLTRTRIEDDNVTVRNEKKKGMRRGKAVCRFWWTGHGAEGSGGSAS